LVIILPDQFSASVESLIEHKNNKGIETFVKTTESIYAEYDGIDEAEQIKYFIKDAVETFGISYVFLLGDINLVPMRKTAVSWDYFGSVVVPNVLTDLYYADIYDEQDSFSVWDTNHDGLFSEVRMIMNGQDEYNETVEIIDQIEGKPDVMVGRLPCSNVKEVEQAIDKIIIYETTTYGRNCSTG